MWGVKKMTDNIDLVTLRGVSGSGPQKTLGTKIPAFPDTKTIVYEGIPNQVTWGMVSRVMMPGGSSLQRANFFPLWRRMVLRFDCGLDTPVTAGVTNIRMHPLCILNCIEEITLSADNQVVVSLQNGTQGLIAQKFVDSVIGRAPENTISGDSVAQFLHDLSRTSIDAATNGANRFCSYETTAAGSLMLTDRGLDLGLLFDGYTDMCNPAQFGRELMLEITLRDMPPTIGTVHGQLLCYSQEGAEAASADMRSSFKFTNLRVEIEQMSYPQNPWSQIPAFTHTFLEWNLANIAIDLTGANVVHRFQLGQTHPAKANIRRLLFWTQEIAGYFADGMNANDGTGRDQPTTTFGKTDSYWLNGGGSWRLDRNGVAVIEANDQVRQHFNSVECQCVCWGGVRLPPRNVPTVNSTSYITAAQVLLTPPPHPHREQWDNVDVHTQIPFGISNNSPCEWSWEYTAAQPDPYVWRDECHIVLENYRSVSVVIDQRTGRASVSRS